MIPRIVFQLILSKKKSYLREYENTNTKNFPRDLWDKEEREEEDNRNLLESLFVVNIFSNINAWYILLFRAIDWISRCEFNRWGRRRSSHLVSRNLHFKFVKNNRGSLFSSGVAFGRANVRYVRDKWGSQGGGEVAGEVWIRVELSSSSSLNPSTERGEHF